MAAIHDSFELPPDKAALHRRAVRLEWQTIAFFVVAISALAIVLGQSQAMKAAWVEDILALAPPIGRRLADRTADDEWAAILAALDLDPDDVRAAWRAEQEK